MRENFGNVVAEAMAAGRPVLVARGLAWDRAESLGAGFIFDRTETSVCEALQRAQSLGRAEWERMSRNARDHVERQLDAGTLGERVWRVLAEPSMIAVPQQLAEDSSCE